MTSILFCKIIYVLSAILLLYPAYQTIIEQGYIRIGGLFLTSIALLTPVLNSFLLLCYVYEMRLLSKILDYKIWEKK